MEKIAPNNPLSVVPPPIAKEPMAEISKNYCATNSDSLEVELRFCPWLKY
jgi:hypothetical protein